MKPISTSITDKDKEQWVHETRFGKWFLSTKIWHNFVLLVALTHLRHMVGDRCPKKANILDIGCGQGQSFSLLDKHFEPDLIKGIDIDNDLLEVALKDGEHCRCNVEVSCESAQKLNVPDNTFDIVFCNQIIHHVTFREEVLQEVYRVLKPGGIFLLAESCQSFLNIYWVRWFFRHPEMEQKTAAGYIDLVREAGFTFTDKDILQTIPWWSRLDFGLLDKIGLCFKNIKTAEIFIVSTKPEEI